MAPPPDRTVRLAVFATLGAVSTSQELAARALQIVGGASPDRVAEETMCLVGVATVRALEAALVDNPDAAAAVIPSLFDFPLAFRDYFDGVALLADDTDAADLDRVVFDRLKKSRAFYETMFPPYVFPDERILTEKMPLWMGRISSPGLPGTPQTRTERIGGASLLLNHLKLTFAFARQPGFRSEG